MSAAASSAWGPSPSAGTDHRRWRTPSSSVTSISAGAAVTVASRCPVSPDPSSNRPTTGLVLTPVARSSL